MHVLVQSILKLTDWIVSGASVLAPVTILVRIHTLSDLLCKCNFDQVSSGIQDTSANQIPIFSHVTLHHVFIMIG